MNLVIIFKALCCKKRGSLTSCADIFHSKCLMMVDLNLKKLNEISCNLTNVVRIRSAANTFSLFVYPVWALNKNLKRLNLCGISFFLVFFEEPVFRLLTCSVYSQPNNCG